VLMSPSSILIFFQYPSPPRSPPLPYTTLFRSGLGIGPGVDQDEVTVGAGNDGREGGAVDAAEGAETDGAAGHERAGVAAADERGGLAGFDQIDGAGHRGVLFPAEGHDRLVVHGDDFRGVQD